MTLLEAFALKDSFLKKNDYRPYTLVTVKHPDGAFRSCGTKEGVVRDAHEWHNEVWNKKPVNKSFVVTLKEIDGVFCVPQEESGWACVGERGAEFVVSTFKVNKETGEVEETVNDHSSDTLRYFIHTQCGRAGGKTSAIRDYLKQQLKHNQWKPKK